MSDAQLVAEKIMALVDEYPSEPFSFERKQVIEKLQTILLKFADIAQDAKDSFYQIGYDEGRERAEEDSQSDIQELEDEIDELRQELGELNNKLDQTYLEGFEEGQSQDRMR